MLDGQPLGEYPELDCRSFPANQPLRAYGGENYVFGEWNHGAHR
ncbi:hypothetical protein PROPHIGD91-2_66 [Mycobacterium phage prophiGD91-2]|nr:hypothetical protein [Mycobacteroides abscessus]QSM03919.1 hypothetical protein PROPHIGD91-2_66 [Mycobacterium phage prophiGD91-2]